MPALRDDCLATSTSGAPAPMNAQLYELQSKLYLKLTEQMEEPESNVTWPEGPRQCLCATNGVIMPMDTTTQA
jgi:hypothetical protein